MAADLALFRNAVRVRLSEVRHVPARTRRRRPAAACSNVGKSARVTSCGSPLTCVYPALNHAERDLRPSKTQQKISGRLRPEKTTRDRYAVRGYLDTARKHGLPVMETIHGALTGIPADAGLPA
jgi:hypothetical protein